MDRTHKILIGVLLGLLVICITLAWMGHRAAVQTSQQTIRNVELVRKAEDLKAAFDGQKALLQSAELRRQAAENVARDAVAKYRRDPAPPIAPPAPQTDPEMASQLTGKGLSEGLVVTPLPSSTLADQDAKTVYSWQELAGQVPYLKAKLTDCDDAVGKLGQALDAGKALQGQQAVAITTCSSALDAERARRAGVEQSLTLVTKEARIQKIEKWTIGGVSVGVVAWLALRRK